MSKIEELIEQLCPEGVEWKELGEVAIITIGKFVHKNQQVINGKYPVYNGGTCNTGFYEEYNNTANKIVMSARGANAGFVNKVVVDYWAGNSCYSISMKNNDLTNWHFVYYILKYNQSRFIDEQQNGGIPAVSKKMVSEFQTPIPPLAIQYEIVTILDKFTQLQAELEAELKARRAQYEYYRNKLLNFEGKEVEWKTLGEVSKILRGTAITKKETISGEFPVVANSPNPIYFHGKSNRSGETIVIARSGAYCGLVSYWNIPFFLTDAFSIHPDNTLFKTKFVYFLLKREQEKIHQMKKGSGVPHVRAKDFETYSVPIPPLTEQERIVAILDKFEALVNDQSVGLPAEIEARRQQYEYYRGKLLDFKNKSNG